VNRKFAGAVLGLVISATSLAQAVEQPLEFEVASIKPASPPTQGPRGKTGCYGVPGSSDPGLYTCSNATVSLMALQAYDLKGYQLSPAYGDAAEFNVVARVPPGTTMYQVKVMLRNLLSERFKLTYHYDKKEVQGYGLVLAKSGLKINEAVPEPPVAGTEEGTVPAAPNPVKDKEGFVYFRVRDSIQVAFAGGLFRWVATYVSLDTLANYLSMTGRPVTDSTGQKGKYDFTLTFTAESLGGPAASNASNGGAPEPPGREAGPSIFAALERQLGLKLEPKKVMIDMFVIDHAEKTPVEN